MADEHHDDEHGGHGKGHGGGGHGGGGHGGGGHAEGEHEGAPEWLISFADNVALMMGFFVVLLAMNMSKPDSAGGAEGPTDGKAAAASSEEQMLDWAIGIREAFNNPVDSSNPADAVLARRIREREEAAALARTPGQKGIEREVKSIRQTNNYSRGGTVPFTRGTVELNDEGRAALAEIIKHRKGVLRNIVDVRGHASAAEAHDLEDRGMKLSYLRAQTVADGLIAAGLGWNQIRIVACGDNDRLVKSTYDELGHRANQRVEVIETDETVIDDSEPAAEKPADEEHH